MMMVPLDSKGDGNQDSENDNNVIRLFLQQYMFRVHKAVALLISEEFSSSRSELEDQAQGNYPSFVGLQYNLNSH